MKFRIIFFFIINCFFVDAKIISTFKPTLIQTDNDPETVEYIFTIENKHHHIIFTESEFNKHDTIVAVDGKHYKQITHPKGSFMEGIFANRPKNKIFLHFNKGIHGLFVLANNTLELMPIKKFKNRSELRFHAKALQHNDHDHIAVFNEKKENQPFKCGATLENFKKSIDKKLKYYDPHFSILPDKRNVTTILPLSIGIPVELYNDPEFGNNNKQTAIDSTLLIVYSINQLYEAVNILVLAGYIEIFTDNSVLPSLKNMDALKMIQTADYLLKSRFTIAYPVYSNTLLMTKYMSYPTVGIGYIATICTDEALSVVLIGQLDRTVVTLTHELGHNFGCWHTEFFSDPKCRCEKICIMNENHYNGKINDFSWNNCDYDKFLTALKLPCLKSITNFKPINKIYCGNNKIDPDEECDCGLPSDCAQKNFDKYCDPFSCKYYPGCNCLEGDCCKNCKLQPKNSICNVLNNECIIGLCTGIDNICEFKEIAQNGTRCNNQKDMCYKGKCIEYGSICSNIFGNSSEIGNDKCHSYFNRRTNQSGNCGYNENLQKFIPCDSNDYLCGKLVCKTGDSTHIDDLYTSERNDDGCTVQYLSKIDKNFKNIRMVNEGITCAVDKTCMFNKCLSSEEVVQYKLDHCDDGICCKNFKIEQKNTPCHPNFNECSIGYCTGLPDICKFKQNMPNGTRCNNQKDMCYNGNCLEYGSICTKVFGNSAELGNFKCHSYFNSRSDESGNCGYKDKHYKFISCDEGDYLCGKLVCKTQVSTYTDDSFTYETNKDGCTVQYISNLDKNFKNIRMVNDGITCAVNKSCMFNKCLFDDEINQYKVKFQCGEYAYLTDNGDCACVDTYEKLDDLCYLKLPSSKILPIVIVIFAIIQVYLLAITIFRLSRKSKSQTYTMRFSKIQMLY